MTEAVTVTLPPQIHDDIVVLQGQEIIRLRDLVQTSEPRLDTLRDENERLKGEHDEVLKELEALRLAQAEAEAAAPEEPPAKEDDGIVRLVDPKAAFRNARRLPAYKNFQIPAFYIGRSPRKVLNVLKERIGYLRLAVFRGGEEEWRDGYESCFVIRPETRQRRDGEWVETKLFREERTVQVVASIYGRWYYLGSYKCVEIVDLDPEVYDRLPAKCQRGLLRFISHGDSRKEARDKIVQGEIRIGRIELQRVAFDEAIQQLLMAAGARQLVQGDDPDSDASAGEA